ncbi:MAG: NADP oxidoreductase [Candidatus Poribacteria bacterium]|jgi:NAD-reducing hydrogenase small subunit
MSKLKIATDWLDICSGCEMSLLDIDERIVELLKHVELTSCPITDLKHPPKEGVDVGILTGSVGNTDQIEVAKEMREHCKILVAFGDCATFSPIPITALRNLFDKDKVLERGYIETESTVDGRIPESDKLCKLLSKSRAISEFVKVDFYLPGCPPDADTIYYVLTELAAGRVPVLEGKNLRYD